MSKRRPLVVSLVERGWQAARACSLDHELQQIQWVHIVKGRLDRSVKTLIAPRPNVRIISVPRPLFWPWTWIVAMAAVLSGRLLALLVDNDRSLRRFGGWGRIAGVRVAKVLPGPAGYEVWADRQPIPRADWYRACHADRADLR